MKNLILFFTVLLFGVILMTGCEYVFVQHPEAAAPEPDPDNPISFTTQIVPIFESRCTECHDAGGQAPDLSAANAFSSIAAMNLVDTDNPTSSKLYYFIEPSSSDHGWRLFTATQASLVLLWIQEGALNN